MYESNEPYIKIIGFFTFRSLKITHLSYINVYTDAACECDEYIRTLVNIPGFLPITLVRYIIYPNIILRMTRS